MDEFLRSASHQIVTGALLLIWSGLLLGIGWKLLSFTLTLFQRLLPQRRLSPIFLRELPIQRTRLPGSKSLLLETSSPDRLLAETPLPLLPEPHNKFTYQFFHNHKENTTR